MASAAAPNDKTVNKVALCSAVFAGFAYVGYSMVRTAFGKRDKRHSEGEYCPMTMNEIQTRSFGLLSSKKHECACLASIATVRREEGGSVIL